MQEEKSAIFQMRFPQKLWYLLNQRTDAIMWGGTGRTILLNYRILRTYLQCDHSIFKTTNISSFVRQLNLYGFRKVTSHLQDPLCNSSNPYMHEYVHDYFQFGRPELLNKITRNALTMKRNFKPKGLRSLQTSSVTFSSKYLNCNVTIESGVNAFNNVELLLCLTPLQKARHALRMALKKASREIFLQNSPELCNMKFDYEGEEYQDMCEEEGTLVEFDWPPADNEEPSHSPPKPAAAASPKPIEIEKPLKKEDIAVEKEPDTFEEANQDSLMSFSEDNCQQNGDAFPTQFLSMPDLDNDTAAQSSDMELLAEFNIENDVDQGIIRKLNDDNGLCSLNCVLPSISHNQIDDETMTEMNIEYNGEWDQMFNDIMTNRGTNQECGSDLKDIYSQISKTIDLLNS